MLKRILLVNPDPEPRTSGRKHSAAARWLPIQVGWVPLGLATVAALTPDHVKIDVWDEVIDGPITASIRLPHYDLVGVTGYVNHAARMLAIAREMRRRNLTVAAGGPGVSSEPERFRGRFDVLFIGQQFPEVSKTQSS